MGPDPIERSINTPDNWDSESFGEPYTLHKDRLELPKLKPDEDQPTIGNAVDKQETI